MRPAVPPVKVSESLLNIDEIAAITVIRLEIDSRSTDNHLYLKLNLAQWYPLTVV